MKYLILLLLICRQPDKIVLYRSVGAKQRTLNSLTSLIKMFMPNMNQVYHLELKLTPSNIQYLFILSFTKHQEDYSKLDLNMIQ